MTVELSGPNERTTFVIFDPKYKLRSEQQRVLTEDDEADLTGVPGQPKKIDIDKMHAYRDALRNKDGDRVVTYAAILFPGASVLYRDGIGALAARPDQPEGLRRQLREVIRDSLELAPTS